MAGIVKCDKCGAVVPHTKAMHVRLYKLLDATSFDRRRAEHGFDICNACYKKLLDEVKGGGKQDGD